MSLYSLPPIPPEPVAYIRNNECLCISSIPWFGEREGTILQAASRALATVVPVDLKCQDYDILATRDTLLDWMPSQQSTKKEFKASGFWWTCLAICKDFEFHELLDPTSFKSASDSQSYDYREAIIYDALDLIGDRTKVSALIDFALKNWYQKINHPIPYDVWYKYAGAYYTDADNNSCGFGYNFVVRKRLEWRDENCIKNDNRTYGSQPARNMVILPY